MGSENVNLLPLFYEREKSIGKHITKKRQSGETGAERARATLVATCLVARWSLGEVLSEKRSVRGLSKQVGGRRRKNKRGESTNGFVVSWEDERVLMQANDDLDPTSESWVVLRSPWDLETDPRRDYTSIFSERHNFWLKAPARERST